MFSVINLGAGTGVEPKDRSGGGANCSRLVSLALFPRIDPMHVCLSNTAGFCSILEVSPSIEFSDFTMLDFLQKPNRYNLQLHAKLLPGIPGLLAFNGRRIDERRFGSCSLTKSALSFAILLSPPLKLKLLFQLFVLK